MTQKPSSVTFFIDRCLGKHPILETLRATGISVEIHDDHFAQNAQDIKWIPEIGKRKWIILTKDASIGSNPLERQAVARAGVRMFTLASQNLSGEDTAIIFRDALSAMLRFIKKHPSPFIAKVHRDGRVKSWKNAEDLMREIEK